jgi:exonuclease III
MFVQDLAGLNTALDQVVPARTESNLLVATWNIRAFGGLTEKWQAGPADSPKRDWHAVACIAEIIRRFDVVAVQEVRRSIKALRFLLQRLGPNWRVIASDVTEGSAGNGERLAFLYDTAPGPALRPGRRNRAPAHSGGPAAAVCTPYFAGFSRAGIEFTLASVHVLWGDNAAERLPEITAFAQWMRNWAERPNDWNRNLMVLGDFNLDRIGDPLYEAFVDTGLWPPAELNDVPRTIFDDDRDRHFYDQIAWFSEPDGTPLLEDIKYNARAGSFDFLPHIMTGLTRNEVSWRISDHYPLWTEFRITRT